MSLKHTGIKALQQDTIDALNSLLTKQTEILEGQATITSKLSELEIQLKTTNMYYELITDEKIAEPDIE